MYDYLKAERKENGTLLDGWFQSEAELCGILLKERIQDSYILNGENRLKAETFADRLPELVLEDADAKENPLLAILGRLRENLEAGI